MNAIDLLKADHDRVEQLFKKFKKNEDGSHAILFRQIRDELETHTHIEEAILYPACLKRGKADLKKIVREGLEEHAQVKDLLADLSHMTPRNKQFNAKLTVVVENVEHHVEEEENDMFPMIEDQFSDAQLDKLGAEMEKEKANFQKKHGIKPAPEPKSTVTTIIDKAKEVFGELTGSSTQRERASNGRAKAGKATSARSNTKKNGRASNDRSHTKAAPKPSGSKGKTATSRTRSATSG